MEGGGRRVVFVSPSNTRTSGQAADTGTLVYSAKTFRHARFLAKAWCCALAPWHSQEPNDGMPLWIKLRRRYL
jgi:hypothetical protein